MDTCCLVNAGEEGGRYKNIDLVVVILFKSNLKKRRHFFFCLNLHFLCGNFYAVKTLTIVIFALFCSH